MTNVPNETPWNSIEKSRYVSLTTFRKSGEPVSTAMWFAVDGDAIVMSTHVDSGKVKRLRNSPRVEVRPSSMSGAVKNGVAPIEGTAELVSDSAAFESLAKLLQKKYGLQHRLLAWTERRRGGRAEDRVVLRITTTS